MTYLTSPSQVVIAGAGLGGLGAAISILLAGHDVEVLESASEIAEVGISTHSLLPCGRTQILTE